MSSAAAATVRMNSTSQISTVAVAPISKAVRLRYPRPL
jgi:hypothetical protein